MNRLDVITGRDPITVDYAPGSVQVVEQHDGTRLALRKLDADYDVHDRLAAMASCRSTPPRARWSPGCSMSIRRPKTCTPTSTRWTAPLNTLAAKDLCPGTAALEKINASLR